MSTTTEGAPRGKLRRMFAAELPLIAFTTCAPAAVGVTFCSLLDAACSLMSIGQWTAGWRFAALALAFTTIGMLASVLHLAKPLRSPRSLSHLASSWLSREILAVSIFWGVLALWLLSSLMDAGTLPPPIADTPSMRSWSVASAVLCACSLCLGIVLILVIVRAYRVSGQPGWSGPEAVAELFAVALRVGFPATACLVVFVGSAHDADWASAIACALGAAGVLGAFALDVMAGCFRSHRLEHEIAQGCNPFGRVPRALACIGAWEREKRIGYLASGIGTMALLLALAIGSFRSAFVAIGVLCALASQIVLRAAFYGFCDPGRAATRFPQKRQGSR